MSDEQRRLFRETQAVMSLLEGFSDYVMDEVGRELVPDVERISARFHERRNARRSPFERAVLRLTGMDLKLEQYGTGERFVRAIADAGGPAALAGCGTARSAAAPRRDRRPGALGGAASSPEACRTDGRGPRARSQPPGPGRGPDGVPAAIALTPILVGALPRRATWSASARRRPAPGS